MDRKIIFFVFRVVAAGYMSSTDHIKPSHENILKKQPRDISKTCRDHHRSRHNHLLSPFCIRAVLYPDESEILRLLMAKTRGREIEIENNFLQLLSGQGHFKIDFFSLFFLANK